MTVLVAAGLAAAAVLVLRDGPSRSLKIDSVRRRRVLPAGGLLPWRPPPAVWASLGVVVAIAPAPGALSALLVGAALMVGRHRAAREDSREAAELADLVADAATSLAADLAVGSSPHAALEAVVADLSRGPRSTARAALGERLGIVAATGRLGGDVPSALRTAGSIRGGIGLGRLAAGWQVADVTGSGMALVLDQVAQGLRRERLAERRVTDALAAARASARLLVALPVFGLVIGSGLGASPAAFLLGPPAGRACLLAGLGLAAAGLWWTDRIGRRPASGP